MRNWIDRGELPAVRVGKRRLRVRQSDLDALLASGTTIPDEGPAEDDRDEPRAELARQLERTQVALGEGDAELASALLALSESAERLARALRPEPEG